MSGEILPEPPAQLKAIQSYMRVAADIERVDPKVAYWTRLYSTETALAIDKDSPECKAFLGSLIVWLEKFKQTHKGDEAISNQTVGQAHVENFVVALFNKADTMDREGIANKNTIRMFFMAAVLFESMAVFGQLTEDISQKAKYAKFKAAYIQKCLKLGQTPKPGPLDSSDLEDPSSSQPQGNNTSLDTSSASNLPQPPAGNEPFIMTPSSGPPPVLPASSTDTQPNSPSGNRIVTDLPSIPIDKNAACNISKPGSSTINATKFHATNGSPLNAEDIIKGQKYCKFANSALQYDDITTAVANLEKALKLLTMGERSE